jgi:hypothetical protein
MPASAGLVSRKLCNINDFGPEAGKKYFAGLPGLYVQLGIFRM